jgi:hypothetical protein
MMILGEDGGPTINDQIGDWQLIEKEAKNPYKKKKEIMPHWFLS